MSNITFKQLAGNPGDQLQTVQNHLGEALRRPSAMQVHNPKSTSFACIDGREKQSVVAVPGGDAGIYISSMVAATRLFAATSTALSTDFRNKYCSKEGAVKMLNEYLSHMSKPQFYYHLDDHAVERVSAQIGSQFDIVDPKLELRPQLKKALTEPNGLGCAYLKQLLTKCGEPAVVANCLDAILTLAWNNHAGVNLVTLVGDHQETAILSVKTPTGLLPAIPPNNEATRTSVFVKHDQAMDSMFEEMAGFLVNYCTEMPWHGRTAQENLSKMIEETMGEALGYTVEAVASTCPIYEADL